jgi:fatty acid desaturase
MEYHIEHHVFPIVPSYNLPKLHELIKDQLPPPKKGFIDEYKEIIPAILKQSKYRLLYLLLSPYYLLNDPFKPLK